ncbi:hypothetical protein BO70DRAFT_182418 [Aspergillus heteromorphus CBS 117.55]|uniref:Uncharacterized protein n=1 Tax=Aspergillus heteromorphus CBS 117.55 TaxID=1448321 RepID=A0A317WVY7_9EURO|nr:uncharacterized protein BO70DRAFT_182418 [Aspergillus heteromorphus CBS 117.55]PWY88460.1 hypothetical protein BO70DRAFT_182418 [Aspergillus heteromorphus CBS 117.55]
MYLLAALPAPGCQCARTMQNHCMKKDGRGAMGIGCPERRGLGIYPAINNGRHSIRTDGLSVRSAHAVDNQQMRVIEIEVRSDGCRMGTIYLLVSTFPR